MTGLEAGNRLNQDVVLQTLLLYGLERSLSDYLIEVRVNEMREVRSLAASMRAAMDSLKQATMEAQESLLVEVERGNTNAQKVRSMTKELKEANLEVEAFLGETGSNFTPSEASSTQQPRADANGVTLNTESK